MLFKRQHDASLDPQKDGTSEIWPQEETVTPFNFSLLGFKCKLCCNCCYYYCILYLSFFTEWLIVVSATLPVTEKWRRYRFLLQFVPKNKQKKRSIFELFFIAIGLCLFCVGCFFFFFSPLHFFYIRLFAPGSRTWYCPSTIALYRTRLTEAECTKQRTNY